jgi:hypothetical protein
VGYSDHGVRGDHRDRRFLTTALSIVGTVTFPGEPTDTLEVYGNYWSTRTS